jgi:hypothetical protein
VASGIASFVIALASPVAGFATPFSIASEESLIMNNSPALPPAATSDASGNLTVSLPVPTKQTGGNPGSTATDGDATCPPTQAEVDQGLLTCAVAVANLSGVNFGASLLEYPGQPSPHPPTLTLSAQSSTVAAGTTITATGTGWWGAGPGSDSIPAANVKVGGVAATTAALTVRSPVIASPVPARPAAAR